MSSVYRFALVGNNAKKVLGRLGALGAVDPADVNVALVGPCKTGEHVDGRGLSGAVGAQKTVQLTLADAEGNAVDGLDRFKLLE